MFYYKKIYSKRHILNILKNLFYDYIHHYKNQIFPNYQNHFFIKNEKKKFFFELSTLSQIFKKCIFLRKNVFHHYFCTYKFIIN
jgi:hypothetical protein